MHSVFLLSKLFGINSKYFIALVSTYYPSILAPLQKKLITAAIKAGPASRGMMTDDAPLVEVDDVLPLVLPPPEFAVTLVPFIRHATMTTYHLCQ
jgi:hypothetical protein